MDPTSPTSERMPGGRAAPPRGLRCDFCGEEVLVVRRIALDRGYDRLRTPHVERYACPACSEKKERQRQGLTRG